MNVVPSTLVQVSYIVHNVSLFEFIIAQSPHSMKGILIGFYYTSFIMAFQISFLKLVYYSLTELTNLIFIKLSINTDVPQIYCVFISIFAILNFIMYSIVFYIACPHILCVLLLFAQWLLVSMINILVLNMTGIQALVSIHDNFYKIPGRLNS